MKILTENVAKTFIYDTLICSTHALQLMKYQMGKYNWTYKEWDKYYQIYVNNMNKIKLYENSTY